MLHELAQTLIKRLTLKREHHPIRVNGLQEAGFGLAHRRQGQSGSEEGGGSVSTFNPPSAPFRIAGTAGLWNLHA